jgi:hypothetical protein
MNIPFTDKELAELKYAIEFYNEQDPECPTVAAETAQLKLQIYFAKIDEDSADDAVRQSLIADSILRKGTIDAGHRVAELIEKLARTEIAALDPEMTMAEREGAVNDRVVHWEQEFKL